MSDTVYIVLIIIALGVLVGYAILRIGAYKMIYGLFKSLVMGEIDSFDIDSFLAAEGDAIKAAILAKFNDPDTRDKIVEFLQGVLASLEWD